MKMKRPIQFVLFLMFLVSLNLSSCVEDDCENNVCENGGACDQGSCMCPEGFRGAHCEEKIMPYRMRVTSVTLTRFPTSNAGVPWDETNGPDIYFSLYEDTFSVGKPLELILDAAIDQSYTFLIDVIEMRDITSKHVMKVFDYEGYNLTPAFMGEVEFVPYSEESGLPGTIVLDNGGPVALVIGVTYLYPKEEDQAVR
jgi:hypothetical protein